MVRVLERGAHFEIYVFFKVFKKRSHLPKKEGLRVQGSLGRPCFFGWCLLLRQEETINRILFYLRERKKKATQPMLLPGNGKRACGMFEGFAVECF